MKPILSSLSFFFASLTVLASPWLFAAWEMWWFWPFAVSVFAATGCFALRLAIGPRGALPGIGDRGLAVMAIAGCLPFLAYALIRFMQAEVFMDAERSFLLFLTPFLLAAAIVFGFSKRQLNAFTLLLLVDLFGLGLYGVVNHYCTGSTKVLWMPAYPQYVSESRASGSYYCPDHFSGMMELALCMGLGFLMARETRPPARAGAAATILVAGWGILLSKSRGGGMTTALVLLLALIWGVSQWRTSVRWLLRTAVVLLLCAAAMGVMIRGRAYVERFRNYPWANVETVDRYQMAAAALRAWRTSPVFGIGPGMHQNLWPHFAASEDGDRERGKWPRFPNNTFHSYEVHNDWIQLLEEYGMVGFMLLLAGGCTILRALFEARRHALAGIGNAPATANAPPYGCVLAGILALFAMAFHSLGDFNLQMPATVWMFAAIVAVPIAHAVRTG